jgi:hypothetical protein
MPVNLSSTSPSARNRQILVDPYHMGLEGLQN